MVSPMPLDPDPKLGPKLLRDWIADAAQRDPEKPWIVCADDGRTVSYRELREVARPHRHVPARPRHRANDRVALLANNSIEHLLCYFGVMAYGATICTVHVEMNRNQLDNIFARLAPTLVLHQDGLELDDLLADVSAPRMRLGRWDKPDHGTFFAEVARRAPSDAQTDGGRRRRRGDPVHLGHQRAAQGRGAELSRAPREHRSHRRRLRHHGGRPGLRFPLVQLGLGAAPRRAGAGQPRRHSGHGGRNSPPAASSGMSAITA